MSAPESLFASCAKCGNDRFSEDRVITTKGAVATFKTVLVCDQCREPLNYYGLPITPPEQFDGEHNAIVPAAGGLPPFCTCGWTRFESAPGVWVELSDHLREMREAG